MILLNVENPVLTGATLTSTGNGHGASQIPRDDKSWSEEGFTRPDVKSRIVMLLRSSPLPWMGGRGGTGSLVIRRWMDMRQGRDLQR